MVFLGFSVLLSYWSTAFHRPTLAYLVGCGSHSWVDLQCRFYPASAWSGTSPVFSLACQWRSSSRYPDQHLRVGRRCLTKRMQPIPTRDSKFGSLVTSARGAS